MSTIEQPTLALEVKPNGNGMGVVRFDVADTAIVELADQYLPLVVRSVDDERGYRLVRAARLVVKDLRVQVEKKRKELKDESLKFGRLVDSEARRLTALLDPIEQHLIGQEEIVTKEKERLAKIEADRIAARNRERLIQLAECDTMMDPAQVAVMPDEQFAMILKAKQDAYTEKKRVESEEKAAREAEAAQLAAYRDRLDKIRLEQEAAQKKIDDDRRALAEAEGARLREAELEQARQDAAERARVETEKRIAHEREEAEARRAAESSARIKAQALKPDKAKLLAVADAVLAIEVPIVSSGAEVARTGVLKILAESAQKIRELACKLGGEGIAPLFQ